MKADSIILILYLLPLAVCTFYTTRNVRRLLKEGYRLGATGIYKAFLAGAIPGINIFAAAYYLAVGIINVLGKITEKINDNENNRRNRPGAR